ncbi:MAG: hypothetical protein Q9187_007397, partial [Circinaria calcarea]
IRMPSYEDKARAVRVVANSTDSEESASGQTAVESGRLHVAGPSTGSTDTRATHSSTRAACAAKLGAPQPEIIDLEGDTLNDEEERKDDERQGEEAADDDAEEEEEEEADDTLVVGESGDEHGFSVLTPAESPDGDEDDYCDLEVDESEDLEDVGDVELNEEDIEALRRTRRFFFFWKIRLRKAKRKWEKEERPAEQQPAIPGGLLVQAVRRREKERLWRRPTIYLAKTSLHQVGQPASRKAKHLPGTRTTNLPKPNLYRRRKEQTEPRGQRSRSITTSKAHTRERTLIPTLRQVGSQPASRKEKELRGARKMKYWRRKNPELRGQGNPSITTSKAHTREWTMISTLHRSDGSVPGLSALCKFMSLSFVLELCALCGYVPSDYVPLGHIPDLCALYPLSFMLELRALYGYAVSGGRRSGECAGTLRGQPAVRRWWYWVLGGGKEKGKVQRYSGPALGYGCCYRVLEEGRRRKGGGFWFGALGSKKPSAMMTKALEIGKADDLQIVYILNLQINNGNYSLGQLGLREDILMQAIVWEGEGFSLFLVYTKSDPILSSVTPLTKVTQAEDKKRVVEDGQNMLPTLDTADDNKTIIVGGAQGREHIFPSPFTPLAIHSSQPRGATPAVPTAFSTSTSFHDIDEYDPSSCSSSDELEEPFLPQTLGLPPTGSVRIRKGLGRGGKAGNGHGEGGVASVQE